MTAKAKLPRCRDIFRHICENLDDELRSPKCRVIRQHLEACPNCLAYLDSLKKTVRLFRGYPDPHVPSKTRRQLLATLRLESSTKRRRK